MNRIDYIFLKFIIKGIVQYMSESKCTAYIQTSDTMANNKMAEIIMYIDCIKDMYANSMFDQSKYDCRMCVFRFKSGFEIDDVTFYASQHFVSSVFMLGDGFSIQLLFKNRKDAEDFVRRGREYENKRKCVVQ